MASPLNQQLTSNNDTPDAAATGPKGDEGWLLQHLFAIGALLSNCSRNPETQHASGRVGDVGKLSWENHRRPGNQFTASILARREGQPPLRSYINVVIPGGGSHTASI